MWPRLDSTTYPLPRYPAMVLTFVGDSTMTSRLTPCCPVSFEPFSPALPFLGGTLFPYISPYAVRATGQQVRQPSEFPTTDGNRLKRDPSRDAANRLPPYRSSPVGEGYSGPRVRTVWHERRRRSQNKEDARVRIPGDPLSPRHFAQRHPAGAD